MNKNDTTMATNSIVSQVCCLRVSVLKIGRRVINDPMALTIMIRLIKLSVNSNIIPPKYLFKSITMLSVLVKRLTLLKEQKLAVREVWIKLVLFIEL